jgi:hypothetical protein
MRSGMVEIAIAFQALIAQRLPEGIVEHGQSG